MKYIILTICLIILIFIVACKRFNAPNSTTSNYINSEKIIDTVYTILQNNDYSLKIETQVLNDTLDVVDYREDEYSNPIIIFQDISFYFHEKLIRKYNLPLEFKTVNTISNKILNIPETPIYEICTNNEYFIIQGADNCNGSRCPEFIGIYNLKGEIIFEGFSKIKSNPSLNEITKKYKIDTNNKSKCLNIEIK